VVRYPARSHRPNMPDSWPSAARVPARWASQQLFCTVGQTQSYDWGYFLSALRAQGVAMRRWVTRRPVALLGLS
jgi:hypothetical protein